jgi:ferrochelatase
LYKKIWRQEGSPLKIYSQNLQQKLQLHLKHHVALGMHYSKPSIASALAELDAAGVKKIIVLPLYPQYSATTTASAFDLVANTFKKWRNLPDLQLIQSYSHHPSYIQAIATSIQNAWQTQNEREHLLFSFHGIPKRYANRGDPYPALCHDTANAIANILELKNSAWSIGFQSRIGSAGWITPYTDELLLSFPKRGIKRLQVVCPGFAVDCLETLEEIHIRGREQFLEAGGESFHTIPALNDSDEHVCALSAILSPFLLLSHQGKGS